MLKSVLIFVGLAAGALILCDRMLARFFATKVEDKDMSPAERDLQNTVEKLQKLELEYEISQELGQTEEALKDLASKITELRAELEAAETSGTQG